MKTIPFYLAWMLLAAAPSSFAQEEVSIKVDMSVDTACETIKTDERFITDLNHAINISLEDDHLSLLLHNDNGVIHFEPMKSEE